MAGTTNPLISVLGFIGIVFGAANLVGGLLVTDRMLALFKKKKPS
jgi:NAD(P) transhydrogenase subunit alpha